MSRLEREESRRGRDVEGEPAGGGRLEDDGTSFIVGHSVESADVWLIRGVRSGSSLLLSVPEIP